MPQFQVIEERDQKKEMAASYFGQLAQRLPQMLMMGAEFKQQNLEKSIMQKAVEALKSGGEDSVSKMMNIPGIEKTKFGQSIIGGLLAAQLKGGDSALDELEYWQKIQNKALGPYYGTEEGIKALNPELAEMAGNKLTGIRQQLTAAKQAPTGATGPAAGVPGTGGAVPATREGVVAELKKYWGQLEADDQQALREIVGGDDVARMQEALKRLRKAHGTL